MTFQIIFSETNEGPFRKLAWATDLHLDAADKKNHRLFFESMIQYQPNAILIGGDISNGSNSLIHLKHLAKLLKVPFYFVLGNHDFYYGSIQKIRQMAKQVSKEFQEARYLTDAGVMELTPSTALIGHDGWADGLEGDFLKSTIKLHDYFLIDELKDLSPQALWQRLNQLGAEAAEYLKATLIEALKKYERVILLTHTPPFREACLYQGKISDDNWAPHFVSKRMGEYIREVMLANPDKHLLVLCGHTHSGSDIHILPNLRVLTGQSDLGLPSVQGLVQIK